MASKTGVSGRTSPPRRRAKATASGATEAGATAAKGAAATPKTQRRAAAKASSAKAGSTGRSDKTGPAKAAAAKPAAARPAATKPSAAKPSAAKRGAAKPGAATRKPARKPAGSAGPAAGDGGPPAAGTTAAKSPAAGSTATKTSATKTPATETPATTAAGDRRDRAPDTLAAAASTRASDTAAAAAAAPAAHQDQTEAPHAGASPSLIANLERIESLNQRLIAAFANRASPNPGVEGPGPELFSSAVTAWMKMAAEQPSRILEQQVNFWGETLKHYAKAQGALAMGKLTAPEDDGPTDRRFANPLWKTHPFFNYVKRQYQINADAMRAAAADLDMPDAVARRRLDWLTGQIVDMMAPTNFLATNPDALEKAIATEGQSLVRGLENLVRDVEMNRGELVVSLADRDAFTVGENIGTSAGRVVHRAPLFELIQYAPATDQVHAIPMVIFPPWINKFYILDLKPENSLIRWLVGQGHTVFVVSWKNPDPSYVDTGLDDYVAAYLDAMDQAQALTRQKRLNIVGYCIAGTTLAATLGLLNKRGDDRVNSATFFTTLTDFSDLGEFVTFLQPDFVEGIRDEIARNGMFPAHLMSRTMSFLRANDLVWGPAIRSYMLGETPPAFDLLYWNGDSTNLPGRMTLDYLDGLCIQNRLVEGGFEVMGHKVTLADVTVPLCSVACETDHIAPWKDCWKGVARMGSKDKRFILSESGHIAGIVNPPSKKKYGHYTGGTDFSAGPEAWKAESPFAAGSWWPVWGDWLAGRSGPMLAARRPDDGLAAAPGDYVHERAI